MERDSFIFYRSFYESLSYLDKEQKADCLDAIARYALDGIEPQESGIVMAIFTTVKPQIDANNRRYLNGLKGGKPKANQNVTKANQNVTNIKPSLIKPEPNDNDNVNVNDNVNDNDNVNVNDNEKREDTNYQKIIDMYNDTCVSFPKVTKLSDSRRKAIKARLNKYSIEDIQKVFTMAEQSDFLKGSNKRNWSATFDWLMNDTNMAKVLDGNYNNRGSKKIEMDSKFRNFIEQNQVVDFGI